MHKAFTHNLRLLPLHGATVPLWVYPATVGFAFLATVIWSNAQ